MWKIENTEMQILFQLILSTNSREDMWTKKRKVYSTNNSNACNDFLSGPTKVLGAAAGRLNDNNINDGGVQLSPRSHQSPDQADLLRYFHPLSTNAGICTSVRVCMYMYIVWRLTTLLLLFGTSDRYLLYILLLK